jgi:hypothetical protein
LAEGNGRENPKSQIPNSKQNPNPKTQAPNKHQIPKPKNKKIN